MELFHISTYISVPLAALLSGSWYLKGTYRQVEIIFPYFCVFYLSAISSPRCSRASRIGSTRPVYGCSILHFDVGYLLILTALVGTTIAPWQFFYLQASFVEKKVSQRQYPQARLDVLLAASVA